MAQPRLPFSLPLSLSLSLSYTQHTYTIQRSYTIFGNHQEFFQNLVKSTQDTNGQPENLWMMTSISKESSMMMSITKTKQQSNNPFKTFVGVSVCTLASSLTLHKSYSGMDFDNASGVRFLNLIFKITQHSNHKKTHTHTGTGRSRIPFRVVLSVQSRTRECGHRVVTGQSLQQFQEQLA